MHAPLPVTADAPAAQTEPAAHTTAVAFDAPPAHAEPAAHAPVSADKPVAAQNLPGVHASGADMPAVGQYALAAHAVAFAADSAQYVRGAHVPLIAVRPVVAQ